MEYTFSLLHNFFSSILYDISKWRIYNFCKMHAPFLWMTTYIVFYMVFGINSRCGSAALILCKVESAFGAQNILAQTKVTALEASSSLTIIGLYRLNVLPLSAPPSNHPAAIQATAVYGCQFQFRMQWCNSPERSIQKYANVFRWSCHHRPPGGAQFKASAAKAAIRDA